MVTGLPSYILMLRCCFKPGCKHPGKQSSTTDHLPLTFLYPKLILVDLEVGHARHVKTSVLGTIVNQPSQNVTDEEALKQVSSPPSVCLK